MLLIDRYDAVFQVCPDVIFSHKYSSLTPDNLIFATIFGSTCAAGCCILVMITDNIKFKLSIPQTYVQYCIGFTLMRAVSSLSMAQIILALHFVFARVQ